MTDREKLEQLLGSFGISPCVDGDYSSSEAPLTYLSGEGGVEGYSGFFCIFEFNKDGSFKEMGVWE